jgi:hypothetical protein
MWTCRALCACAVLACATNANAVEFSFDGYADLRLVVPPDETGWVDGGSGKTRFGGTQPSPNLRFAEAIGQGDLAIDDDLHAVAVLRIEPETRSGIDLLETYVAWHPQASGDWRWSLKAGAFFPPVSVENDDLGWTSPYTLTPSAINSWVGNELRTIGGEGTLAWSGGLGTLTAVASLFCCNEPAGILMAQRGWTLDDRPTGLFERVRIPDATAALYGMPVPSRTGMFENIDGHVGWYAGFKWDVPGLGQAAVLRYDNQADPDAFTSRDTSWRTRFWAASFKARLRGVTVLAQGMTGDTAIGDGVGDEFTTRFQSAFVLASYDLGDWRVAGRAEAFATRNDPPSPLMDEDGHALTAAVSWYARTWLRLEGEVLSVDSRRGVRAVLGTSPQQTDLQEQLSARLFF